MLIQNIYYINKSHIFTRFRYRVKVTFDYPQVHDKYGANCNVSFCLFKVAKERTYFDDIRPILFEGNRLCETRSPSEFKQTLRILSDYSNNKHIGIHTCLRLYVCIFLRYLLYIAKMHCIIYFLRIYNPSQWQPSYKALI